ncbi:Alpha/Beta hydrolase protein [Sporodiniella umbellata]|nr:Alpha/Beta hydrolase protein [Sporodiniella umbellata]
MMLSYLRWRYWQLGSRAFHQMVSVDIPYSATSRLDVYHPFPQPLPSPVIIFIYGGSWSSGSKLLYRTFANSLRELGYVVVVPDYQKYPDGHSAGAHLASQVVLSDVIDKAKYQQSLQMTSDHRKHDPTHLPEGSLDPHQFLPQIEGLLLFSGVYDIKSHLEFETARGVDKISAMARAMGSSEESYKKHSPLYLIERNASLFAHSEEILDIWPRILLLHGQKDTVVGMVQSADMFNMLGRVLPTEHREEVDCRMRLYKRMHHGEPVTALMPDLFSRKSLQKSLIRDIKEFIDVPSFEENPETSPF